MAELPLQKKSEEELSRMRMQRAMTQPPPSLDQLPVIQAQASRALLALGYLLSFIFGLGLLPAGWIAWKRPPARHHAAIMAIFSILTLLVVGLQWREQKRVAREEAAAALRSEASPLEVPEGLLLDPR